MGTRLTRRERLRRTIAGQNIDRLPVALWRHFFTEETSREGLVDAMVRWQKTYDWDFLKINPRAGYHAEDWGNLYEPSGSAAIKPTLVRAAVHAPDDFRRLERLDAGGCGTGREAPVLLDHLQAIRDLRAALGPAVPMLMTVFTPMSIVAELAGGPQDLAALIKDDAALVHVGLRTVTDTFAAFAAAAIEAGADGLFLATTHVATRTNFTPEQYAEFGRPYDLEVLRAVQGAPLNLLHVCQPRSLVRELADYPARMLNWDMMDPSNPDLGRMRALAPGKGLVGGLEAGLFRDAGGRERLLEQLAEARRRMRGRPFVVAGTCTIDPESDPDLVRAVREAVETG